MESAGSAVLKFRLTMKSSCVNLAVFKAVGPAEYHARTKSHFDSRARCKADKPSTGKWYSLGPNEPGVVLTLAQAGVRFSISRRPRTVLGQLVMLHAADANTASGCEPGWLKNDGRSYFVTTARRCGFTARQAVTALAGCPCAYRTSKAPSDSHSGDHSTHSDPTGVTVCNRLKPFQLVIQEQQTSSQTKNDMKIYIKGAKSAKKGMIKLILSVNGKPAEKSEIKAFLRGMKNSAPKGVTVSAIKKVQL